MKGDKEGFRLCLERVNRGEVSGQFEPEGFSWLSLREGLNLCSMTELKDVFFDGFSWNEFFLGLRDSSLELPY